jgi:hypothetical protein
MRRALCVIALMVVGAASAQAVDVVLRDGTVIHATSYQITGSYLTVVLPDGRQVAYSTSDVDLDALRSQEATTEEEAPPSAPPGGISAALARLDAPSSLTISDSDVEHVAETEEEAPPEAAGGPPPGHREGGQVGLQNVQLNQVEPGVWETTGQVVNHTGKPVGDVRVQLELYSEVEGKLASADVAVTATLNPTEKASFSHRFSVATEKTPRVRARTFWMQELPADEPLPPPSGGGSGSTPAGGSTGPRPTPRA